MPDERTSAELQAAWVRPSAAAGLPATAAGFRPAAVRWLRRRSRVSQACCRQSCGSAAPRACAVFQPPRAAGSLCLGTSVQQAKLQADIVSRLPSQPADSAVQPRTGRCRRRRARQGPWRRTSSSGCWTPCSPTLPQHRSPGTVQRPTQVSCPSVGAESFPQVQQDPRQGCIRQAAAALALAALTSGKQSRAHQLRGSDACVPVGAGVPGLTETGAGAGAAEALSSHAEAGTTGGGLQLQDQAAAAAEAAASPAVHLSQGGAPAAALGTSSRPPPPVSSDPPRLPGTRSSLDAVEPEPNSPGKAAADDSGGAPVRAHPGHHAGAQPSADAYLAAAPAEAGPSPSTEDVQPGSGAVLTAAAPPPASLLTAALEGLQPEQVGSTDALLTLSFRLGHAGCRAPACACTACAAAAQQALLGASGGARRWHGAQAGCPAGGRSHANPPA